MSRLFVVLVAIGLAGCGMKGSLMLPPGPPPEPLLGNSKPAAKPSQAPADSSKDVSTDKTSAPQQ